MADIFVASLTTLVILCLSFLFWKWITWRNQLFNEQRIRSRVSAADVRKNRLKRFESEPEEIIYSNLSQVPSLLPVEVVQEDEKPLNVSKNVNEITEESDVNQVPTLAVDANPGVGLEDGSATRMDVSSAESSHSLTPQPSGVGKLEPVVKRPISRRWVTLLTVAEGGENSVPVTRPLTSLDELRSWNEGFDEFNVSSTPLMRASRKLEQRPRTIVCHDMKGGYVEDRFVQGFSSSECYRIYHWQYIDIFVYFSHNFITIPPPCWTNTAHKHGVQVLGTVITEWEDGATRCAEMFTDKNSYQIIVNQLVNIAKYHGFDGWLINIENAIQPAQVNNLVEFLNQLTSEMHHHVPGSLVIWYDSVTYNGDLKWQNELNPENRVFFDVSDGIFLNYGWNETNLTMSARAAGEDRCYDVYVGVDVFGRDECFGGGGWNTNKATKVIKSHDLSLALFAPGWVYEKYQSTFQVSQNKFWNSIASDCTIHTLESMLPFVTSFCQGYGDRVLKYGKVIHSKSWTHLGAQQIQPSYTNHIYSLGSQNGVLITAMEHSCLDAYNGGGSLLLQGSTKPTQTSSKAVVRLFKTDLMLPSTILVSFTTKLDPDNTVDVALQLHIDKKPTYIMLCPQSEKYSQDSQDHDSLNEALLQRYGVTRSQQLSSDNLAIAVGQEHYRLFAPLTGDNHSRLHTMCCAEDGDETTWCTRYYLLAEKDLKGSRVKEIRLVLMNKTTKNHPDKDDSTEFQLFVGEVKILDAVSLRRPLPIATSLYSSESYVNVYEDGKLVVLSLTLSWSYDNSSKDPWERFEIHHLAADGSTKFLGLSFVMSFFVSNLSIPKSQKEVKFVVQAVDCAQRKEPLENCPMITIHWT